ncbi:MAG: acyl--CoA ligase [Acidisphaera sp.]|nr:acyl--CoA ligase [Acidisphaera sp.]
MPPSLSDILAHDVRHFPSATALTVDGDVHSYAELARRVAAVRDRLAPCIAAGDRLAIWLPNSLDWVAGFLAAAELGAITVPVNTRLVGREVRDIVEDAGARALLTVAAYRGRRYFEESADVFAGSAAAPALFCGDPASAPGEWRFCAGSQSPARDIVDVPDLLCIQYTSGTTSRPKGVMLTNAAYVRTAAYVARAQLLTPSSRFMSAAPFFHCSGSMHAITVCLFAGCGLHTMTAWDPELATELVARLGCTVSHALFLRDVMELPSPGLAEKWCTMTSAVTVGTPELLMRAHDELGIAGIANVYGMTETAGNFTMWYPDDPLDDRVSGNGRAMPGNLLRIGDPATGEASPAGPEGEIQMHGPTVFPGYFKNPTATCQAFTADGWLRSGDLGRLSDEGALTYVARLKDVIRVGGENLSPAEVEEALLGFSAVQEVCVLGIPDERLDEVPAAVIVLDPGAQPDWGTVMAGLKARLAGYKIPKQVYVADALPKTATNKVQRAALKQLIGTPELARVV